MLKIDKGSSYKITIGCKYFPSDNFKKGYKNDTYNIK